MMRDRLKAISTGGAPTEAQESKLYTQLCSEIFNIEFAVRANGANALGGGHMAYLSWGLMAKSVPAWGGRPAGSWACRRPAGGRCSGMRRSGRSSREASWLPRRR